MKVFRDISLCMVAFASVACSGSNDEKVDIGNRNVVDVGEKLSDFAGSWDGYAEAFEFEPGSDRVRVTMNAQGEGTVRFGESAVAPVPTEPFQTYPPDYYTNMQPRPNAGFPVQSEPGFEYQIRALTFSAKRLRFELQPGDLVDEWCQLQPAEPFTQEQRPGFACFGDEAPTREGDGPLMFRGQVIENEGFQGLQYCRAVCECTEGGCLGKAIDPSRFDGSLEANGSEFVGTLAYPGPGYQVRIAVRMSRNTD